MDKSQKPNLIKILIAVPSRGEWQQVFSQSVAFLIHKLTVDRFFVVEGKPCILLWHLLTINSSILPQSRQEAVDAALGNGVDYLLFLDDDMGFPETLLHEWINENRPVIAANCPTRGIPTNPTARNFNPRDPKGTMVYSDLANYRFDKVWRVGTGVMLLRKDALQALPRPAFTPRWEPSLKEGKGAYVGEDWVMCEHLEAAGIPILVDHQISLQITHTGTLAFSHDNVKATRMAEAKLASIPNSGIGDDLPQHNGILIARD